jgi:hypothetical protein
MEKGKDSHTKTRNSTKYRRREFFWPQKWEVRTRIAGMWVCEVYENEKKNENGRTQSKEI